MSIEHFILLAISIIAVISLFYIPKHRKKLALVGFLAFEATTWASTNILVQTGVIAFPVREFMNATSVGFVQNFIFYPVIFMWFLLLFPEKSSVIAQISHYIVFISAVVWFIYFVSVYTGLEDFTKGTEQTQLIRLYISFLLQFGLCHLYTSWFSKKTGLLTGV